MLRHLAAYHLDKSYLWRLSEARRLSKVIGPENLCSTLALSRHQLGAVDLREALVEECLAEELANATLYLHDSLVGRHAEVKPPIHQIR